MSIVQIVNLATYYSILLTFAIIPILALMLLQVKDDLHLRQYWSRILFLTLLLMLCVHLFSPRGIYKYYCVALIPFFSIQPVSQMISLKEEKTRVSLFMILMPFILSLLILFPNRNVYLAFLLLMLIGYIAHNQFAIIHDLFRRDILPFRQKTSMSETKDLKNDVEKEIPSDERSTLSG